MAYLFAHYCFQINMTFFSFFQVNGICSPNVNKVVNVCPIITMFIELTIDVIEDRKIGAEKPLSCGVVV